MKHDPITKQRSEWMDAGRWAPGISVWKRLVSDGMLAAIVADPSSSEGEWHLSISFRNRRGLLTRYPHWDEIMHARIKLIPADIPMHMIIPPLDSDDYVALHPTTFHLHQDHHYQKDTP